MDTASRTDNKQWSRLAQEIRTLSHKMNGAHHAEAEAMLRLAQDCEGLARVMRSSGLASGQMSDNAIRLGPGNGKAAEEDRTPVVKSLVVCPNCDLEMRLFGIETESEERDLFTFECITCDYLEVRGVLVVAR